MRIQPHLQPLPKGRPPRPTPVPPEQNPAPPLPQKPSLIDTLKRRSSLVNMLDPAAMTLSLVTRPAEAYNALSGIATALYHGQTSVAQSHIEGLVHQAVNPRAPYSYFYRGGQVLGAVMDGTIGGLEIAEGIRTQDNFLTLMGAADMLGGTASAAVAAGFPTLSLGMTLVAAAGKSTLVLTHPAGFSRIQKMKTCFEAGMAVSTSMLRAGVAVVPALCFQTVLGGTELLYMNVPGFQKRADACIDWVGGWLKK